MDRRIDEADYVAENLRQARQEITAHPEWFEPDALERVDKAIVSLQELRKTIASIQESSMEAKAA